MNGSIIKRTQVIGRTEEESRNRPVLGFQALSASRFLRLRPLLTVTALAGCTLLAASQPGPIAVEPHQLLTVASSDSMVQKADIIDEILEVIEKIINPGGGTGNGGNP